MIVAVSPAGARRGLDAEDAVFRVGKQCDRRHRHVVQRLVVHVHRHVGNHLLNVVPFHESAKHGVAVIQKPRVVTGDEELRIIRIIIRFGHPQDAGAGVLKIDIEFVIEIAQRRTSAARARWIAALNYEIPPGLVFGDTVKNDAVIKSAQSTG